MAAANKTTTASTIDNHSPASAEAASAEAASGPVIVDIGKGSRKGVRKLRKGKAGKLMRRVEEAIAHLTETGVLAAGTQPVVIVVRERPRRAAKNVKRLWGLG